MAADSLVPNVALTFWSFRFMVGIGFLFLLVFATSFWFMNVKRAVPRWFLHIVVYLVPLPWIAAEFGWITAEVGRQPWIIDGVLPTFMGVSSLDVSQVLITMIGFTVVYGALLVVEMGLMRHAIIKGPQRDGYAPLPELPGLGGGSSDERAAPAPATPYQQQFDK